MTNLELANAIYSECYGHLDDKRFRHDTVQEIEGWLDYGDVVRKETVRELSDQWREYAEESDDATAWNLVL